MFFRKEKKRTEEPDILDSENLSASANATEDMLCKSFSYVLNDSPTTNHKKIEKGLAFEDFLSNLFETAGYEIVSRAKPKTPDKGIDIIMIKNGKKHVVQAKAYALESTYHIDKGFISKFIKDTAEYPDANRIFITTHYFSPDAIDLANANNIKTLNRESLFRLISKMNPSLMAKIFYERDTQHMVRCSKCGSIYINKSSRDGNRFSGCVRYPRCKETASYSSKPFSISLTYEDYTNLENYAKEMKLSMDDAAKKLVLISLQENNKTF